MLKSTYRDRLARARRAVRDAHLDAMLVCPSADFVYLTGASLHMRERPIFLVITPGRVSLLCPRLEAESSSLVLPGIPVWDWPDGEDAFALLREKLGRARRIGVNSLMRADWVMALLERRPESRVRSAAPVMARLRSPKESGEIRRIQAAADQADRIMGEARRRLKTGVREEELAQWILRRFEKLGAVNPWAQVASAENGAMPHHSSGPRRLRRGDVVIVDLGAELNGYQSDITRTFFIGEPEPEAWHVYDVVRGAQFAGRAAVRAGSPGRAADRAAREFITRHGYGKFFIHRLGHGLGMEVHEEPNLDSTNRLPLPEGAVVTVEPGIYLPGRFGIRLEDVVVARKGEPRTLTRFPLDLALLK